MHNLAARAVLASFFLFGSMLSVSEDEPAAATAEPAVVVLSSGVEGGGYWSAGTRLQTVAAKEVELVVENLPSTGSLENLEKLLHMSSPVSLAFAQADAVQYYLNQHEDEIAKLDLLENIGQECVFLITGADSDIRTDKELREATDLRLGIASETSGIAVTFNYMVSQAPELADIKVSYLDTRAAMDQLGESDAAVDAVMVVHRPREHSAEVDYALANAGRYRFVELSDERFTQEMWKDRKVYRTMNLAMPGSDVTVKTLCVPGLFLANKEKLSLEQRNKLSKLVDYYWMQVYATE